MSSSARTAAAIVLAICLAAGFFYALGRMRTLQAGGRIVLTVWGLPSGEETYGLDAQIREFERRHPNILVRNLAMGAGTMNAQKLLTSIAGGTPPDLVRQDRFTIGDWASRGAFMPLDRFLTDPALNGPGDPWRVVPGDLYNACWQEALYGGKVYAIPEDTDDRLLFWNRKLFAEAGLDPNQPPRTWDDLVQFSKKLTRTRRDGSFARIGFIPINRQWTNSWFYLYSWQNGGEFMSPDGRRCTLNNPASAGALRWLVDFYDSFAGAEQVMAFASTFQPREQDPFITGKMAMKISTHVDMGNIARYGPDLDYGLAPPPAPVDRLNGKGRFAGQPPFITWSGGYSFVIPAGCRHPEEAWQFIKWMTSLDGWRVFNRAQSEFNRSQNPPRPHLPRMTANRRHNEIIFREFKPLGTDLGARRLREGIETALRMMSNARYRPVTFVGQKLWDEHARATDLAIHHKLSPEEALAAGQAQVQQELDRQFARGSAPLLDIRLAWGICLGICAALFGAFLLYCRKQGAVRPLMRREALAGYLFAAPWITGFVAFIAGPMIASAVFSFCDYDVLHPPRWVGLQNYQQLFADPLLGKAFGNIFFLAGVGLPLSIGVSLGLAMLLNNKAAGMPVYRTIFYLPSLTPLVAMAVLWLFLLNPDSGIINQAWRATAGAWFGWPAPTWLAGEAWAKPALILMSLWTAGGGIILWLAGLQGVPRHLYEAAELDGAGRLAQFRHVTLPMITPYLLFNLIIGAIGWLQRFTDIYVVTDGSGGPVDSTLVPVLYLFNNAFQFFRMGYASAWAWLIFLMILILTAVQFSVSRRWVYYEGERK